MDKEASKISAISKQIVSGEPVEPVVKPSMKAVVIKVPTEVDYENETPFFIYGGPFIKPQKSEPFWDIVTPINLQLQGTFKQSFAYYSLRERLPVILTKIVDYVSREAAKIQGQTGATLQDISNFIAALSEVKSNLVTNKEYAPFVEDTDKEEVDTDDAKQWNVWIANCDNKHYFNNAWVFTECYVYRKIREACELNNKLANFDPFAEQKQQSCQNALELMCQVAEKLMTMLPQSDKDKRKADFVTLLKICLWANKLDLSLSLGDHAKLWVEPAPDPKALARANKPGKGGKAPPPLPQPQKEAPPFVDPFDMLLGLKFNLLVDHSAKIADQVVAKAEKIRAKIDNAANAPFKQQCDCHKLAKSYGVSQCLEDETKAATSEEGEPPKIPCPAKLTVPSRVTFDIVCDNAGYELFADLCLAHFLIAQQIVQRVRFHVKKIPWFISDVTPADFKYLINWCIKTNYNKTVSPAPKPGDSEGDPGQPRVITSQELQELGRQWNQFVQDGTFLLLSDDFWTSPHVYKNMKKYDYYLYRKLQYACAIMFKGDLNYRKLLGERNCNPVLGFEPALQGFHPAPIIAVRSVKADLICGLPEGMFEELSEIDNRWTWKGTYGVIQFCEKEEPLLPEDPCLGGGFTPAPIIALRVIKTDLTCGLPKGKWEQINKIDARWMQKGMYGTIQFCGKAEALKAADRPCMDYGDECRGKICPAHPEL